MLNVNEAKEILTSYRKLQMKRALIDCTCNFLECDKKDLIDVDAKIQMEKLQQDRGKVDKVIFLIDLFLENISEIDSQILRLKFFDCRSYRYISRKFYMGVGGVRYRIKKSIESMIDMIGGQLTKCLGHNNKLLTFSI